MSIDPTPLAIGPESGSDGRASITDEPDIVGPDARQRGGLDPATIELPSALPFHQPEPLRRRGTASAW